MRHVGWQEEDLPLADGNHLALSVHQDVELDVPLELVEELLALVHVEVAPGVWAAHYGHHELAVRPDLLIAHRGLQQVPVLVDPLLEVERLQCGHGFTPASSRCTSARWRW